MKSFKTLSIILLIFVLALLVPTLSKANWKGYTNASKVTVYQDKRLNRPDKKIPNKGTPITIKEEMSGYGSYKIKCRINGKEVSGFVNKSNILLIRKNSFVNTAIDVHKYVRTNGYTYNSYSDKKVVPLNATNSKLVDCGHYVTAVLYEFNPNIHSVLLTHNGKYVQWDTKDYNNIGYSLKTGGKKYTKYFKLINKKNAKAGDILVYGNHVEILAETLGSKTKNYKVYNCGRTIAIKAAEASKTSKQASQITYILRVK